VHRHVDALDSAIGVAVKVLDDGFVRLVDYMGNDEAIVEAARVSYGAGTRRVQDDEGLIRYLLRHRHTTPFEMCEIKFHVRVPMDAWRQWIRHRTANVNEYSTRYSVAIDSAQTTPEGEWRLQSPANRQGSAGYVDASIGKRLSERELALHAESRSLYEERLQAGVAREQARKDLPLSTYTEAFWKIDLHNLLHFLRLRLDQHAQHEIRSYAEAISTVVALWVPITWAAFCDYEMNALTLSAREMEVLSHQIAGSIEAAHAAAARFGWCDRKPDGQLKANRERDEFLRKAHALGVAINWF
jgi:thymidylate synthase (FAD)